MKQREAIYQQVADELKQEILKGVYPVGSHIPTEIVLENKFKVSKINIRKAIDLLVADGYVQKKTGVGTVVLSDRLFNKLVKTHSFTDILEAQGLTLTTENFSVSKISLKKSNPLFAILGKECLYVVETFHLDGHPYMFSEHFLPLPTDKEVSLIQAELAQTSLNKWTAQNQQTIASFQDTFTIGILSKQQQKFFSTNDQQMLQRTRKTYTQEQETILVTYTFYNTTIAPYTIDYQV